MSFSQSIAFLENETTSVQQYAHPEGNNIMSWIGFKHIMYSAELALAEHMRRADMSMRRMFEDFGLVAEIVQCKGRILHAVKLDEPLITQVSASKRRRDDCLNFDVRIFVNREGKPLKAYSGAIRLVFKQDESLGMDPLAVAHTDELRRLIASNAVDPEAAGIPGNHSPQVESAAHQYTLRIPYYFCHGNERLKMSGYLRILEQADAEFCEARGISINDLLRDKRWIPAVPSAQMTILKEAFMEEDLQVTYRVIDVVKDFTYKCALDCHVYRDGQPIHVATGEIVHAYAEIHNRKDWGMVNFDTRVMAAIGAECDRV